MKSLIGVLCGVLLAAAIITTTGQPVRKESVANTANLRIKMMAEDVYRTRAELSRLRGDLAALLSTKYDVEAQHAYVVTATAYAPVRAQTDNTPWETATLTRPVEGRTLAVSRDLGHLLYRWVNIIGYGYRYVEDLMNERFTRRIDFFITDPEEAAAFGVKRNLTVVVVPKDKEQDVEGYQP